MIRNQASNTAERPPPLTRSPTHRPVAIIRDHRLRDCLMSVLWCVLLPAPSVPPGIGHMLLLLRPRFPRAAAAVDIGRAAGIVCARNLRHQIQMGFVFTNMFMMAFTSYFFEGFVLVRVPFPLTNRFKVRTVRVVIEQCNTLFLKSRPPHPLFYLALWIASGVLACCLGQIRA